MQSMGTGSSLRVPDTLVPILNSGLVRRGSTAVSGATTARGQASRAAGFGNNGQPFAAGDPVDLEIAVQREDPSILVALGDVDERCVGQVHREIAIPRHQLAQPRHIVVIERRELDGARFDHRPERGLLCPGLEDVHGFDQCRPDRDQRVDNPAKGVDCSRVILVAAIDQGDEGPGINEDAAHETWPSGRIGTSRRCARTDRLCG